MRTTLEKKVLVRIAQAVRPYPASKNKRPAMCSGVLRGATSEKVPCPALRRSGPEPCQLPAHANRSDPSLLPLGLYGLARQTNAYRGLRPKYLETVLKGQVRAKRRSISRIMTM